MNNLGNVLTEVGLHNLGLLEGLQVQRWVHLIYSHTLASDSVLSTKIPSHTRVC